MRAKPTSDRSFAVVIALWLALVALGLYLR